VIKPAPLLALQPGCLHEFKDGIDKFEAPSAVEQTWTNIEKDLVKAEKKYRQSIKDAGSGRHFNK
jgi:hypothetical protein